MVQDGLTVKERGKIKAGCRQEAEKVTKFAMTLEEPFVLLHFVSWSMATNPLNVVNIVTSVSIISHP